MWRKSISGLVECVEKVWSGSKKCYTLKSIISPLGCAKAYWSGMEKYQWVTCYNMQGKEEKKDAKQQQ